MSGRGRQVLAASFLGFETHRDTLYLRAGERQNLTIELEPASLAFDEVVVTAEGQGQAVGAAGLQTITPKQIEMAPMPDISGDLIAYLQVLPGIMSPGDRGGQLFVRGGTPAQNLILLDGIPLFQPFHIVGFFSAFPSDIVRSANIYAGRFRVEVRRPAVLGDRRFVAKRQQAAIRRCSLGRHVSGLTSGGRANRARGDVIHGIHPREPHF